MVPQGRQPTSLVLLAALAGLLLLSACPESAPSGGLLGGGDSGAEVGPDLAPDLVVDSSLDASTDADAPGQDADPDAAPDASADADADQGGDAALVCRSDLDCTREGWICDEGSCRPAADCEERDCGAFVVCDESTSPPTCLEACEGGLRYEPVSGSCVADEPNCTPGAPGSLVETCAEAYRVCVESSPSASCGDCVRDYLDEGGTCRPVVTCSELSCAALDRDCDAAGPHSDAECGDCSAGYIEDEGGDCVLDTSATCRNPDLDPFSIADECEAELRECVVLRDGAVCGGCVRDYAEDDLGECVPLECEARNRARGEAKNECGDCLDVRVEDSDGVCLCPAGLRDDPFTPGGCVEPDVCPFNYRGDDCEVGCPLPFAHWGGRNEIEDPACDNGFCADHPESRTRDGVWMCAQTAAAAATGEGAPRFEGAGIELVGEVPAVSVGRRAPLCEDAEDCSRGYSVR